MFIEALQQQRTDNPNHKFYNSEVIDFYSRAVHVVSVLSPEIKTLIQIKR